MKKMLGVMLDCSRNAVMNLKTVKKFVDILSKMGYNTLMLYTEDTYEVNNQPFFGHLRGRYSKDELKEIDRYCKNAGIELIACIQTLAHLENMFKWRSIYDDVKDCDNVLLIDDENTYKLIEDMISTVAECFSSRKIHIGMDEAYRVGRGKFQDKFGVQDKFEIMNRHLHKVCEITDKYGLEPFIWSDMFVKLATGTDNQYDKNIDSTKILEKAQLPENISLVYWDYYSTDYNDYAKRIETNKMFGRNVYFAGGAWTWKGFAPDNKFSIASTDAAVKACRDCDIEGMFFTVWGDNGSECSKFAVLPSLMYAAEAAKGNTDLDEIKKKFKNITGCEFESFMLLDKLDDTDGHHGENPSKYLLYNDLFLGMRDYLADENSVIRYGKLAEEIRNTGGKGEYGYIFDFYEKLAEVVSRKCNLGNRTKTAYKNRDLDALKVIAGEYEDLISAVEELHILFENRWFTENKPHGFDVQDIRFGGLVMRIKSCRRRLERFISGEILEIPELDEPDLKQANGYFNLDNDWSVFVTPNAL